MSFSSTPQVGVPARLLQKFEDKKVLVDSSTGEIFEGTLLEADDEMNVSLVDVKTTFPSGHTAEMKSVYVKGSKIRYIGLPNEAKGEVSYLARQAARSNQRGRGGGRGGGGGRGRGGRGGGSFQDRRRY